MVLVSIVLISLSSNKLGNNFVITDAIVLAGNWLATSNNFWCRQELKMWVLGALFEQKRFSLFRIMYAFIVLFKYLECLKKKKTMTAKTLTLSTLDWKTET